MVEPIDNEYLDSIRKLAEVKHMSSGSWVVEIDSLGVLQLLARLDAAESRAAELQREMERLHEAAAGEDV